MNYEKKYCLDIYYIKSENLTELKTSNLKITLYKQFSLFANKGIEGPWSL